ncbi:MAG: TatD family hydrolase [Actinobacteria bacterium]|nr:TatD family hydrolase [Actinomycetota bacterium]
MIDTHAHLDACADPPPSLIARAREAGVTRILDVATSARAGRRSLELAEEHDEVFAILGIHPHESAAARAGDVESLRELLGHRRAVALGETGLDFFRDYAPRQRQLELFKRQLDLAAELDLTAVIHTRAADDETLRELERFPGTVVLHCFSSPGLLAAARERDYYVSFAGNVTYPSAEELRSAAAAVPAARILAETDCPYLAPQPRRGRPNEPANVIHTLAALAEARGEDRAVLEARIEANARAAFSLP